MAMMKKQDTCKMCGTATYNLISPIHEGFICSNKYCPVCSDYIKKLNLVCCDQLERTYSNIPIGPLGPLCDKHTREFINCGKVTEFILANIADLVVCDVCMQNSNVREEMRKLITQSDTYKTTRFTVSDGPVNAAPNRQPDTVSIAKRDVIDLRTRPSPLKYSEPGTKRKHSSTVIELDTQPEVKKQNTDVNKKIQQIDSLPRLPLRYVGKRPSWCPEVAPCKKCKKYETYKKDPQTHKRPRCSCLMMPEMFKGRRSKEIQEVKVTHKVESDEDTTTDEE